MSCLLRRNAEGNITEVLTPTGDKSLLFDEIHGNIFMSDAESSAKITSLSYSPQIQKQFPKGSSNTYSTGEPKVFYQTDDATIYNDIEDLLIDDKQGNVKAGFINPKTNQFIPVVSFSTNEGPVSQFMSDQILEGVLSTKRVLGEDGITRLQGKGIYDDTKAATASLFASNARTKMGYGNVTYNKENGLIELNAPSDLIPVEKKDGSYSYMTMEEALNSDDVANKPLLIVKNELSKRPLTRLNQTNKVRRSDSEIVTALQNFLSSLGFSMTTLDNYRKRYNTIYGKDPDIQAMADISNRIVAFQQGQLTLENLSEEVAHIAIEAYSDQGSIVSALAVAHLTPEYAQYADYYRGKYSQFYEGVELEDQVRKEVLGKVLAKEFLTNFRAENREAEGIGLVAKLREIWDAFVRYISGGTRPYHLSILQELNKDIIDSIASSNFEKFQNDLSNNKNFFYSAMSTEHQKLQQNLVAAKNIIESSAKTEGVRNIDRAVLERIDGELGELNMISAANTIIGIIERKVEELSDELKAVEGKTGIDAIVAKRADAIKENLEEHLIPLGTAIEESLKTIREESTLTDPKAIKVLDATVKAISKTMRESSEKFRGLRDKWKRNIASIGDFVIEREISEGAMSAEEANKVRKAAETAVGNEMEDSGTLFAYFGMISDSKNPVLALIGKIAAKMATAVRIEFNSRAGAFVDKVLKGGLLKYQGAIIDKDENGKPTHYFWGPLRYAAEEKAMFDEEVRLVSEITKKDKKVVDELMKQKKSAKSIITEAITIEGSIANKSASDISDNQEAAIQKFNEGMEAYKLENYSNPMDKQYYVDQKEKFENLKISLLSKETIKIFNIRSAEVIGNKRNKDGSVDKTKLSQQEVEQLNRIKKEREMERNPYDAFQEVKEGLRIIPAGQLTEEDINEIEANFKFRIPANYKGDIITIQKGLAIDQLSDRSRLSLDLNNLSYDYQFNNTVNTKVSDSFYAMADEMRKKVSSGAMTNQELFDWVTTNGTISFSDEYYESLGDASRASELLNKLLTEGLTPAEEQEYNGLEGKVVTYASQVEAYIKTIDDDAKKTQLESLFKEYKDLNRKRKYLLKENKRAGSALDVNVHAMDVKVRTKILEIEGRTAAIRNDIKLPERFRKQLSTDVSFELNDDFMKRATELGLAGEGDIFTFALDHMTHANKRASEDFAIQIEKLLKGSTTSINSRYEKFFEELDEKGVISESMPIDRVIAIAKDEFAKTKVASYYKKYQPATFRSAMDALKNGMEGKILIEDFIRWSEAKAMGDQATMNKYQEMVDSVDGLSLIKITPDFSWQQDITAGKTNGSYKRGLYYKQLNEKWLDDTWFDFYGITKEAYLALEDDDISQLVPTKNKEQFELLKEIIKKKEETLDLLGDKTSVNKWLRPQIKKSQQESLLSMGTLNTKGASIFDSITSVFQTQVDEQEYGNTGAIITNDKTITTRFIPKYFQTRLEDPAVLSEASFSAVLAELKEAIAYKEKTKSIKEVRALIDKLENQNFIESGSSKKGTLKIKKGQVSNQLKIATEFVNWKYYGVQQSRQLHFSVGGMEFDATRILSAIQRFSNLSNLGFNWAADITGATTGVLNSVMDRASGEYFHNSSINKANGTAMSWVKDYSIEMEALKKDSKLGKTYELFGITDASQSLADSNVASPLRFLRNSWYLMSRVSNLTLAPKIAISALYDYRLYKGKFLSFQNFVKQIENESATEGNEATAKDSKDIENRWNNLQDSMLMDYMDYSQTYATYNNKFREMYDTKEEADEAFKAVISRVSSKVQKAVMNTDGVLNDTDRVAAQRDVLTNMVMQHKGWIPILFTRKFKKGAYNFSTEKFEEGSYRTILEYLQGKKKELFNKGEKIAWNGLEDYKQRNIIRATTELSFAIAALLLGSAVLDGDDDDDTLFENIFQLIYLRTTSELVSSTGIGMTGVIKETIKDPIPSMDLYMLAEPYSLYKDLSSDDEEYGNKFFKRVVKASPLKIKARYSDVQTMIDNFRFYNDPTLLNLGKFSERQANKAERIGIEGVIRN